MLLLMVPWPAPVPAPGALKRNELGILAVWIVLRGQRNWDGQHNE